MNRRPALATVIAFAVAGVVAGCGGGGTAGSTHPGSKDSAPVQGLPSAPDPRSIKVPTGAPVTSDPALALPTGPSGQLSPADLWRRAAAVMAGQKSAALTIDFRDDQGRVGHAASSVASNGDCVGTLTVAGGRAQVVHVGQTPYLKGDAAFWAWAGELNGASQVSRMFTNRWIKGAFAQLGAFSGAAVMCSLPDVVGNTTSDFGGPKSKGASSTVDGHQVVALTQTSDTATVTLYVALTGPAVVLKAVHKDATTTTTTFRNLGAPVHAVAPTGALG